MFVFIQQIFIFYCVPSSMLGPEHRAGNKINVVFALIDFMSSRVGKQYRSNYKKR